MYNFIREGRKERDNFRGIFLKSRFMKNEIRRMCYASAFLCNFLTGFSLSLSLRTHSSVDVAIFHCDIPGLELSLENSTCSRFIPGRVVIDYLLKQSVIPSSSLYQHNTVCETWELYMKLAVQITHLEFII